MRTWPKHTVNLEQDIPLGRGAYAERLARTDSGGVAAAR